ncbi:MAG: ATP phosphoribosyltransferase regulatory subunit [Patescibacteria group bacterium]|nr:ATP phosphoribosyltransferase regulatory subunit [Patescibacteria group bacterium]
MGRPKKNPTISAGYVTKKIQNLPGMTEILTSADALWDILLKRLSRTARAYGFNRIEPPLLEEARLFETAGAFNAASTVGVSDDVFGRPAVVRPTLLPSVLRAYAQQKIYETAPLSKWWYSGFTAKKQEKNQPVSDFNFGFEVFGTFTHLAEAQLVSAVWELLQSLGLKDLSLEINSIGEDACQRVYEEALAGYLSGKKYELCDSCSEHLKGRVLNVFRCNNLDCQAIVAEAPTILDYLDPKSHKHFTNILEALDEMGIPYQLNHLYSGPNGHSRTNFVIKYKTKTGVQVLGEGGYHDGMIQSICGKNFCAFGFYGSLTGVYELLAASRVTVTREQTNEVFLVPLGELASKKALRLFRDLISSKISVYDHFGDAGVKNQLKAAQVFKAPIALIMGQKEAMDEMVILRDVKSGMQEVISYDKIVEEVKKRLGK